MSLSSPALAAMLGRAEAATEGPWEYEPRQAAYHLEGLEAITLRQSGLPTAFAACSVGSKDGQVAIVPLDESSPENALFLAHARTDVPLLVAEVRALRAVLKSVEWEGSETGGADTWEACPLCRQSRTSGHAPDCALRAALGEGT